MIPVIVYIYQAKQIESNIDILKSNDERLTRKISFISDGRTTISKLNQFSQKYAKIRIQRGEFKKYEGYTNDDLFPFRVYCKKTEMASVMDALASLDGKIWTRMIKKSDSSTDYDISSGSSSYFQSHQPNNEAQKKYWETVRPFFDYIDQSNQKESWLKGDKFKLSQLPVSIQGTLQNFLQEVYDSGSEAQSEPKDMSNVTRALISVNNKTPKGAGYSEYFLNMETIYGNFGVRISNFPTKLQQATKPESILSDEERSELPSGLYFVDYNTEKHISRKESILSDIMNQRFSYNAKNSNIFTVLKGMSSTYSLNFVCNEDDPDRPRKNLQFNNLPLWQLLDRLCEDFGGWSWELRSSGVIVLRHPKNIRHRELPDQNQ
jgi:hypothetical protein